MKIYYAFYKGLTAPGTTFNDKAICLWTRGLYSHVEIIVDDFMYTSSPRDKGVRRTKHVVDNDTWDYIEVSVRAGSMKQFEKFFKLTENCKYDWLGISGFVIPIHDNPNKYFCSEWCAKAGIIMDLDVLYTTTPARLSPNKLYDILEEKGGYKRVIR